MYLQTCRQVKGGVTFLLFLFLSGKASLGQGVRAPHSCCCDDDTTIDCYSPDKQEQIRPADILYDFKTKNIAFPKDAYKLKRSDAVRIKVSHFNPILYQVVIDGRDSSAHSVMDSNNLLSAFMTLSNLSTLVTGLNSTVSAGTVAKAVAEPLTKGMQIQNFIQTPAGERGKGAGGPNPPGEEKDCLPKLKKVFGQQTAVIDGLNDRLSNLKSDMTDSLLTWDSLFAAQRHIYPECDEFTTLAGSGNRLKASFKALKKSIGQLYKDITKAQRTYLDTVAGCTVTIKKDGNDAYRVRDSLIKTYYTLALANLGIIDTAMNYKLLLPLEQSIDRMKDVKSCYTSAPIFLMGDSRIFSLAFKPFRDSLPTYGPMVFELPWSQRRIWGISGGFYTAYLPSEHYTGQQATGDTLYKLVKDNTGNMEVGINALAYVAWKVSWADQKKYNYMGVSFGAAMSINSTPKPRLLLGASYVSGRTNRLLVSLGLMAGYTDKLSNAYNLTDRFSASGGYTKNVMRVGPFLSLNYSFF